MTMMSREDEEFREQRKLIRELSEGHQYAQQLMNLLAAGSSDDEDRYELQKILIEAVVHSFESAIGILKPDDGGRKTAGNPVGIQQSESPPRENAEVQARGSCKKRKPSQMPTTTTTISAVHEEDGYAWRKYGQKDILGSQFPRSYFRCTHKFDQGCQAIKQVQKLDHNPSLLQITYMGSHTCKPTRCSPDFAAAAADPADRHEFFLNFETNSIPSSCFPPHSSLPFFKQEDNEDLLAEPAPGHWPAAAHYSSLHLGIDGSFDLLKQLRLGSYGGDVGPGDFSLPGFDMGMARLVEFDDLD